MFGAAQGFAEREVWASPIGLAGRTVDSVDMGMPKRVWTYDDELDRRRRQLAARDWRPQRLPIDLAEERLRRLRERTRDTRDP